MGAELSIPANIFDEMAGMKDTTPPKTQAAEENVKSEPKTSEINQGRLTLASHAFFAKVQKQFISKLYTVYKKLLSYSKQTSPSLFSLKGLKRFIPFRRSEEDDEGEDQEKSSFISKIWEAIKKGFKILWKIIKWIFKQIVKRIIKNVLKPIFEKLWNWVKKFFSKGDAADAPKKKPGLMSRIMEKPKQLWNNTKEKIKNFINKIKNTVQKVMNSIRSMINKITSPVRKVKELIKNIFEKFKTHAKNVINTIKQRLRALVNSIKKAAKKVLQLLKKQLKKFKKVIFKAMKKVLASIWKIVKKLFFKGKPMLKMFTGEPKAQSMNNPSLSKKDNHMNLKMKGPKKKESFIMKAVKKVFKKFIKPIGKLIKKVFGKLIKKLIKTIVKMVVRFIAAQVIGSLLPGIGNAIAMAACMAMMVAEAVGMVDFISGIGNDISQISEEMSEIEPEEPDEPDDDFVETPTGKVKQEEHTAKMAMDQLKATIDQLEKEGKTNTIEYYNAKSNYLHTLAEQYRKGGDSETAEIIEAAIKYGRVPQEGELNLQPGGTAGVRNLNLEELQAEIARNRAEKAKIKYENKKENVIDDSEIDTLLKGEEDGGPMWTSIWREIIWFIKLRQPERLEQERYQNICNELMAPHLKPQHLEYNPPPQWVLETEEEKNARITKGEELLYQETGQYVDPKKDNYDNKPRYEEVISKASNYKFNTLDATYAYRKVKTKEINAQREKHNKLLKGLETIITTRNLTTAKVTFQPLTMIPEPTS